MDDRETLNLSSGVFTNLIEILAAYADEQPGKDMPYLLKNDIKIIL